MTQQGEWHEETTEDGDLYVVTPVGGYWGRYLIGNTTMTNTQHLPGHTHLFANAAAMLEALESLRNAGGCFCGSGLVTRNRPHTTKCIAAQAVIARASGGTVGI